MKNILKFVLVAFALVMISASALAAPAGYKDRLIFIGSSNSNDQVELNYYLENGGSLISFQAVARNNSENIVCYAHVIYPADLRPWTKDMNKK